MPNRDHDERQRAKHNGRPRAIGQRESLRGRTVPSRMPPHGRPLPTIAETTQAIWETRAAAARYPSALPSTIGSHTAEKDDECAGWCRRTPPVPTAIAIAGATPLGIPGSAAHPAQASVNRPAPKGWPTRRTTPCHGSNIKGSVARRTGSSPYAPAANNRRSRVDTVVQAANKEWNPRMSIVVNDWLEPILKLAFVALRFAQQPSPAADQNTSNQLRAARGAQSTPNRLARLGVRPPTAENPRRLAAMMNFDV